MKQVIACTFVVLLLGSVLVDQTVALGKFKKLVAAGLLASALKGPRIIPIPLPLPLPLKKEKHVPVPIYTKGHEYGGGYGGGFGGGLEGGYGGGGYGGGGFGGGGEGWW